MNEASAAPGAAGTADAQALLARILRGQAYRELGAARLFEAGERFAPDQAAADELRRHAHEEREHLRAVLRIWADVSGRQQAALLGEAEARLAERPLPPPAGWIDLAMARFLYDRAGCWQLGEYVDCAHLPYATLARQIVEDERGHQDTGAAELLRFVAAGQTSAQPAFERWLRPALLSFGRPGTAGSALAIRLGLKRRDPALVAADFIADITPTVQRAGLSWPRDADANAHTTP